MRHSEGMQMQAWQCAAVTAVTIVALWATLRTARSYTSHWGWSIPAWLAGVAAGAPLAWADFMVWCWWCACAGGLAVTDAATMRLPNRIQAVLAGGLVALSLVALPWSGSAERITTAVAGALFMGSFYMVIFFVSPRSIGVGDLKLALSAGWVSGFFSISTAVNALLYANIAAAIAALVILSRGGSRKTAFPYGPWMILGVTLAVAQLAWAQPLASRIS